MLSLKFLSGDPMKWKYEAGSFVHRLLLFCRRSHHRQRQTGRVRKERERERRSSHEWFKAEPKKEEGLKPERGESRPTAAVL